MDLHSHQPAAEMDCIVRFGNADWSSWFAADLEKDYTSDNLWKIAEKIKPKTMQEKITWLKIFRFEKEDSL